jgi:hypothetical protein
MGTREKAKKEKTQRRMDGWSKMELEKPWTDRRSTRDRDTWRNLVLG